MSVDLFPRRIRRLWIGVFSCLAGLTLCAATAWPQVYDGNAIMRQPMRENLCALTFDDGPSRYTPHILDVLRENGIPATFFMLGKNVKLYPQHVQRIVAEGHEVGNHSFSHPNLRRMAHDRKREEIELTDRLLRDLGADPLYMRPPYGSYDRDVVDIANRLGVTVVLWSVDSQDWKRRPTNYAHIINAVGQVFPPGQMRGILLFHDPLKTTAADLPKIISDLKAGGCQRFVTVSDYINSVLDPEPPLLWTERTPADTDPVAAAAGQESEALMPPESYASAPRSWPAGSAPLPLARIRKKSWRGLSVTDARRCHLYHLTGAGNAVWRRKPLCRAVRPNPPDGRRAQPDIPARSSWSTTHIGRYRPSKLTSC